VNETNPPAPARGTFGAALTGGIVGSLATAALLLIGAPHYLSTRIVRDGLLSDP
jgi:hypothetical protein